MPTAMRSRWRSGERGGGGAATGTTSIGFVAQTWGATVGREHFGVKRLNCCRRQMGPLRGHDRRRKSSLFFFTSRSARDCASSAPITGVMGTMTMAPPS